MLLRSKLDRVYENRLSDAVSDELDLHAGADRKPLRAESVTYVLGINCHLSDQNLEDPGDALLDGV
jgi:hypothetical protein